MIFTVKRKINGVTFLRDEDRIFASSWFAAHLKLFYRIAVGLFDSSCHIDGVLVEEGELTDAFVGKVQSINKIPKYYRK